MPRKAAHSLINVPRFDPGTNIISMHFQERHQNGVMQMSARDDCADAKIELAKAIFAAFVTRDLNTAERLIAETFSFTSPLDNALDRKAYFSICWPNSKRMTSVKFCQICNDQDRVFVTYEADLNGTRFRNTELLTINEGKIYTVEVYFGWNVPHGVPRGEHRNP